MVFRHNVHKVKSVRQKLRQIRHDIDEVLIKKHKKRAKACTEVHLLWLESDKCSD